MRYNGCVLYANDQGKKLVKFYNKKKKSLLLGTCYNIRIDNNI